MVDIHSHILPFVDDGSDSLEASLELIKDEISNGVDKILLTPHYKSGHYEKSIDELKSQFDNFQNKVKESGLKVDLKLGQEVYVDKSFYDMLKAGEFITIGDRKCILIEFNYFEETDIQYHIYNICQLGYTPIIAHVERYSYLNWDVLLDLKMLGAYIQVNASCVNGEFGRKIQKTTLRAIKKGLIDFVASDLHDKRLSNMLKAYKKVRRVCGAEIADMVFTKNAENLLFN